jgi:hypothetical protein
LQVFGRAKSEDNGRRMTMGDVLNIRRSMWRTHLNDETKTHEDDDDPGVVPIIEPLRDVLDGIKPEIASGWMFPEYDWRGT